MRSTDRFLYLIFFGLNKNPPCLWKGGFFIVLGLVASGCWVSLFKRRYEHIHVRLFRAVPGPQHF